MSQTPMPRLDLDQALHWIRGHLSDPESPPVVVVISGPAEATRDLPRQLGYLLQQDFPGGWLTIDYVRGEHESAETRLGEALEALGATEVLNWDRSLWRGQYLTRTRHTPGMLVTIDGAWAPEQVRTLMPAGRGSLVLASEEYRGQFTALEVDLGARVLEIEPLGDR